jgi:uncharacterized repeat protein (TIGR03803 family)
MKHITKRLRLILFSSLLLQLAQAQYQGSFIGLTRYGGHNDLGSIFSTDMDSAHVIAPIEFDINGWEPHSGLLLASNGKLYGTTRYGGQYGHGLLFEYDRNTNVFTEKYQFDGINGTRCVSPLIQASNGYIYGFAYGGGIHNKGTFFKYDINTNTFTKIFDLDSLQYGSYPDRRLMQHSNGLIYSYTRTGGLNNRGILFSFDPTTEQFTKLADAQSISYCNGFLGLTEGTDGKIYIPGDNGLNGNGLLLSLDVNTNALSRLYDFNVGFFIGMPEGPLVEISPGKFLGTGFSNYNTSYGTGPVIYEYTVATGQFRIRERLAYSYIQSVGPLHMTSSGNVYAVYNSGILRYNLALDTVTQKIHFMYGINGDLDDMGDGTFLNLTGGFNTGTVYEFTPATSVVETKTYLNRPNIGKWPEANMYFDTLSGKMLGTLSYGGLYDYGLGTFIEFDPYTNKLVKRADFNTAGRGAYSTPIPTDNNTFLGVTRMGGQAEEGALYEFIPATNQLIPKFNFGGVEGSHPAGDLIRHSNGKYYGLAEMGGLAGSSGAGTLYEYDYASNTLVAKVQFPGALGCGSPVGDLITGPDNRLYGVTGNGGSNSYGTLFAYDPVNDSLEKLYDFGLPDFPGYNPLGSLVWGSNNKLYGTTSQSGPGYGILFEYDPTADTMTIKHTFLNNATGWYPVNDLIEKDNRIYSYAQGGIHNAGVIFSYDYINDVYTNEVFLDSATMRQPVDRLMYLCLPPRIKTQVMGGSYCLGETILLHPVIEGPDLSYQWQKNGTDLPGATASAYAVSSAAADSAYYSCVVSNYCGTKYTDTVLVWIHPANPPSLSVAASSLSICSGDSVALTASGSGSVVWNNGVINGLAFYPQTTRDYIATLTDANGCTVSDTLTVEVSTYPYLQPASDVTICEFSPLTLNIATNAPVYGWNNGVVNGTPFHPQSSATYVFSAYAVPACVSYDTVQVTVDAACQSVYPGDANNDGVADQADILELGVRFGSTGGMRSTVSNSWMAFDAPVWGLDTVSTGYNLNHADCNGDGIIGLNDTLAVTQNYGLVHSLRLQSPDQINTVGDVHFNSTQTVYYGSQVVAIDVYLGESTAPFLDFYGASFMITYSGNTLMQPGSLSFTIDNTSWVGTINSSAIRFKKADEATGTIIGTISRTDHNNVSGFGKVGTIRFIATNAHGVFSVTALPGAFYIDNVYNQMPLTGSSYSVLINTAVSLQENSNLPRPAVYPNPSNGSFTIMNLDPKAEYTMRVKDLLGRTIYSDTVKNPASAKSIQLNTPAGIYWLEVESAGRQSVHKLIIE